MGSNCKCKFWLPKKTRFCSNIPLPNSLFCGNHTARSDGQWITCPIDPSHSVLQENLESHCKRCPLLKQAQSLSLQPFYQKGINSGKEEDDIICKPTTPTGTHADADASIKDSFDNITSEMKRKAVYAMNVTDFSKLITKIQSIHASICNDICHSQKIPNACDIWINRQVDRKLPFQEKHVLQQASILGNLEEFGVLKSCGVDMMTMERKDCNGSSSTDHSVVPAVVEFGAGRGYLTQMLADCYGIKQVFLVERKSYKLKADRSLRQKDSLKLERLTIDIEDLNLNAVKSLQGIPYLAIGKHLCGPATDMTLRCCLTKQCNQDDVGQCGDRCHLRGLAIATYQRYMSYLGISKEDFNAMTWFTSWAVDADHGSDLSDVVDCSQHTQIMDSDDSWVVEEIVRKMSAVERAVLGFMCKDIIDVGRLMWMREEQHGLESQFVKYVPSSISPENHLLIARATNK
ncbi:hypothetical protein LguiA_020179 [Lonicera macranthoides]